VGGGDEYYTRNSLPISIMYKQDGVRIRVNKIIFKDKQNFIHWQILKCHLKALKNFYRCEPHRKKNFLALSATPVKIVKRCWRQLLKQ
jgi:hypothetical protein